MEKVKTNNYCYCYNISIFFLSFYFHRYTTDGFQYSKSTSARENTSYKVVLAVFYPGNKIYKGQHFWRRSRLRFAKY